MTDTPTPPERAWLRPETCGANGCDWLQGDWKREPFGDAVPYVPEGLTGWRSMDSAPKDGTVVLGFCPFDCGFEEVTPIFPIRFNSNRYAVGWYLQTSEGDETDVDPTHWMPLPTPPEARP